MSGRVEKLAGTEQLTSKCRREKPATIAGRAVENEHRVANYSGRVLSRAAQRCEVNAQLRQHRCVGGGEAAHGEITLPPRSGPVCAGAVIGCCRPRVLTECDSGS